MQFNEFLYRNWIWLYKGTEVFALIVVLYLIFG